MRFGIAAAFALVAVTLYFFTLGWASRVRRIAWFGCTLIVALSPALVELDDLDDAIQRAAAALLAVALIVKLYDVLHAPRCFHRSGFRFYVWYLANWLWLVVRRRPPSHRRMDDFRQVLLAAPVTIAGVSLLATVFRYDWSTRSFTFEHCVKASTVFALLMPLTSTISAAWRLLAGPALDAMNAPFLATTPAEFWRRWNLPAQQFFTEYVFKAAGGLNYPIRTMLFTFLISAAIHEYLFGIATGWFHGWQTLFFMTQGLAAAITARWRPRGLFVPIGFVATVAFNLATSVWFFRSVDAVIPFYAVRPGP
jgi:hypothetical protein